MLSQPYVYRRKDGGLCGLTQPTPSFTTKVSSPTGGSKGELPLLLEIQKPGGFWCIFAYFLYIRKYPRGTGAGSLPVKETGLLKLRFEAECIYSILLSAPNGSLHKTKVSLWAYAAHPRASLKLDTVRLRRKDG